jgi:hypothetical protein
VASFIYFPGFLASTSFLFVGSVRGIYGAEQQINFRTTNFTYTIKTPENAWGGRSWKMLKLHLVGVVGRNDAC